jgi:hypothetical protein
VLLDNNGPDWARRLAGTDRGRHLRPDRYHDGARRATQRARSTSAAMGVWRSLATIPTPRQTSSLRPHRTRAIRIAIPVA